jgi:hypothetical protein
VELHIDGLGGGFEPQRHGGTESKGLNHGLQDDTDIGEKAEMLKFKQRG